VLFNPDHHKTSLSDGQLTVEIAIIGNFQSVHTVSGWVGNGAERPTVQPTMTADTWPTDWTSGFKRRRQPKQQPRSTAKADDMTTIACPTQATESQESSGTKLISNIRV
jgi:hypothetical protein